jgi:hypothetical protein
MSKQGARDSLDKMPGKTRAKRRTFPITAKRKAYVLESEKPIVNDSTPFSFKESWSIDDYGLP